MQDGVYEAQSVNSHTLYLIVEEGWIDGMYALAESGGWFTSAVYEVIHFQRVMSGCSGNTWTYVWEPSIDTVKELEGLEENAVEKGFKFHGGVVVGTYSPETFSFELNKVRGMNNFSSMFDALSESKNFLFSYIPTKSALVNTQKQNSSDLFHAKKRGECRIPAGQYELLNGINHNGWEYSLSIQDGVSLYRNWNLFFGWFGEHARVEDVQSVCDGEYIFINHLDEDQIERMSVKGASADTDNPRVLIVGHYDSKKGIIHSIPSKVLQLNHRLIKIDFEQVENYSLP